MSKRKQVLLSMLAIMLVLGITASVTWAFLSYTKEGTIENRITAGAITFHYNEDSTRGILLEDALPLEDNDGKDQETYFDFTITSNNNTSVVIPYQITARKVGSLENRLADQYVKVYLTKVSEVNNTEVETQVLLDSYDHLTQVTNNNHDEEVLWTDSVAANTADYTQKYRLKMWINSDLDFSPEKNLDGSYKEVDGHYVYPNNNKQFGILVNVYSDNQAVYSN